MQDRYIRRSQKLSDVWPQLDSVDRGTFINWEGDLHVAVHFKASHDIFECFRPFLTRGKIIFAESIQFTSLIYGYRRGVTYPTVRQDAYICRNQNLTDFWPQPLKDRGKYKWVTEKH